VGFAPEDIWKQIDREICDWEILMNIRELVRVSQSKEKQSMKRVRVSQTKKMQPMKLVRVSQSKEKQSRELFRVSQTKEKQSMKLIRVSQSTEMRNLRLGANLERETGKQVQTRRGAAIIMILPPNSQLVFQFMQSE
jgi:hypothetical protein